MTYSPTHKEENGPKRSLVIEHSTVVSCQPRSLYKGPELWVEKGARMPIRSIRKSRPALYVDEKYEVYGAYYTKILTPCFSLDPAEIFTGQVVPT